MPPAFIRPLPSFIHPPTASNRPLPSFINPPIVVHHYPVVPHTTHASLQTYAHTIPAQPPSRLAVTSVTAPIITNSRPSPLPLPDTNGMALLLEEQRKESVDDSSHSNSAPTTTKGGRTRKFPHGKRYVTPNHILDQFHESMIFFSK